MYLLVCCCFESKFRNVRFLLEITNNVVCAFCMTRVACGSFFKSLEYLNKPPVNAPGMRNLPREPDRPISHYLTLLLATIKAPGSDCLLPATTGL